jgi:hypothetical protein
VVGESLGVARSHITTRGRRGAWHYIGAMVDVLLGSLQVFRAFFFRSNWSTPQHSLKVLADFCERILDIENVRLVCRAQQTELTQDNVMRQIMSTKESQSEDLS